MKRLLIFLFITVATFLSGCFETTEGVAINANGTGTYTVTMDMGGTLSFMSMMGAADSTAAEAQKGLEKKVDTTIYFKSLIDTVTTLTAEQKSLLRGGAIHVRMSKDEDVFHLKMTYPFAKVADISKIMELTQSGSGGNIIKQVMGGATRSEGDAEIATEGGGMPNGKEFYDMTYKNGLLERKIKDDKVKEMQSQFQMGGMEKMEDMMEAIKVNSVIALPRPAKNVQGDRATLSTDKKTVTIKCTMKDILANPKVMNYRIEY